MKTNISRLVRYGLGFAAQLIVSTTFAQGGTLDGTFNPGTSANDIVWASAVQADGKVLVGGSFTTYQGTTVNRIARLMPNGSLDPTFLTGGGFNNTVNSIVVQPWDQYILVGGQFTTCAGKPYKYIVRLTPGGSPDPSYTYLADYFNSGVAAIALQPNGFFVVGGSFTTYGTTSRNRVARLDPNGFLDPSFNPGTGASNSIEAVVMTSSGQFYVGGDFTSFNGVTRGHVARLNTNGSLDVVFNSSIGANNFLRAIAIDASGYVLIGGSFSTYNGTSRNKLARVKPDGSLDVSLTSPSTLNSTLYTILVLPNQKLIVGGFISGGTPRGVERLLSNGTLDGTFNSGAGLDAGSSSAVATSFLYPPSDPYEPNKIFIGGRFTSYTSGLVPPTPIINVARLMGIPFFVPGNGDPGRLQSDGTSVSSVRDPSITIYPNPNNGTRLNVDLSAIGRSDSPIYIRILDLQGRLAIDPVLVPTDGTLKTELDLGGLQNGMYQVHAENADGVLAFGRLVIQH